MIAKLLMSCAAFSWWVETTLPSIFLFGECPYPTEDDAE